MYKLTANIMNARGTSCSMSRNQPKLGKKPAKGRRISSQSKYIFENVIAFFEKEKETDELANEYGHNIVFDFLFGIVNSIQLSWHRLQ